jgi:hypothetical protein
MGQLLLLQHLTAAAHHGMHSMHHSTHLVAFIVSNPWPHMPAELYGFSLFLCWYTPTPSPNFVSAAACRQFKAATKQQSTASQAAQHQRQQIRITHHGNQVFYHCITTAPLAAAVGPQTSRTTSLEAEN